MRPALVLSLLSLLPACGHDEALDGGAVDAPTRDAQADAPALDAEGRLDAGLDALEAFDTPSDAPIVESDAAIDVGIDATIDVGVDAATFDAGVDAPIDVGRDAGFDAGVDAPIDVGRDAGFDGGSDTPPSAGCVSGAVGTHVVRFRWNGSTSGSTAWVSYEANTLPDTSLWRVTAASASFGYTPVYTDTFLAEGGLELSGTVFVDVELSTVGLTSLGAVTIALYGRSYATTTSGSFRWQTFDGTGATPSGSMANSAPYEWYLGDATAAFSPGDGAIRLRLRAGPPSSSVVVNRVEICFDAS